MSDAVETVVPETGNPFTLSEDQEFAVHVPEPDEEIAQEEEEYVQPAMPGTSESVFRRCPCIGVMPGRACPRCHCSKWVKTCPKCNGEMFVELRVRKGSCARTEKCGFCMGYGQVAARLEDVKAAEEEALAAEPTKQLPVRSARLPVAERTTFAERRKLKGKRNGR